MMPYSNTYTFADLTFFVEHRYEYSCVMCQDYVSTREPDFSVCVTEEDIEAERARNGDDKVGAAYLEFLALYRKICSCAVHRNVLLFHSSAIALDGTAYLFAAPSGTGKSTHAALWRSVFGDRAVMINDDKPLLRVGGGDVTVYGTPWNGKHRLGANISASVAGICFLSRGAQNHMEQISEQQALGRILSQSFRPDSGEGTAKVVAMAAELARRVPMWSLCCNMENAAAELAYQTMRNGGRSL